MKKNIILLLGIFCAAVTLANEQFEKAMGENIPAIFATQTPEKLQTVINKLNRIGEAEGDRWEPYYYTAFGYLRMSGMNEKAGDKDKYLDLAMKEVEKGETINPNDSELEAMRGYILMIKLTVDPGARGTTYSGLAFNSFHKAISLDPNNPRAYYLLGRMQQGTAMFTGGGTADACASLAKAKELFAKEEQPENPFAPSWGAEETNESIQQMCQK